MHLKVNFGFFSVWPSLGGVIPRPSTLLGDCIVSWLLSFTLPNKSQCHLQSAGKFLPSLLSIYPVLITSVLSSHQLRVFRPCQASPKTPKEQGRRWLQLWCPPQLGSCLQICPAARPSICAAHRLSPPGRSLLRNAQTLKILLLPSRSMSCTCTQGRSSLDSINRNKR